MARKDKTKEKIYRILRRETRRLPVKLTEAEVMAAAKRLGAIDAEQEGAEGEVEGYKSTIKGLNVRLETLACEARRTARAIRTGVEERDVEVTWEANTKTGVVQEVRQDTHEVIHERKMTGDESQGVLFQENVDNILHEEPEQSDLDETYPKEPKKLPPSEDETKP
jgi:hypothetical protein